MYRTFKKNPLAFWRWDDYLFGRRYRLPYLDPDSIPEPPDPYPVKGTPLQ